MFARLSFALARAVARAPSSRSTAVTLAAWPRMAACRANPPVAAEVEDGASFGPVGELPAVVALVAEEPGLVSRLEIDAELRAEFFDDHAGRAAFREAGGGGEAFLAVGLGGGLDDTVPGSQPGFEQIEHGIDPLVHGEAEGLGRENIAVAVDDEPGEAIRLGMDEPLCGGLAVELQQVAAEGEGAVEALTDCVGAGELGAP